MLSTHQWINKIVKIARDKNVNILFEGSTDIQFYQDAFSKNNYSDYFIVLFDCETETMKNRLIERGQPELYQEDMVNWLNYLRRTAQQKNIEIIKTDSFSVDEIGQILIKKFKSDIFSNKK